MSDEQNVVHPVYSMPKPVPYGERLPAAYDVAALAEMLEAAAEYKAASQGDDVLSKGTRNEINRVVNLFCGQFGHEWVPDA